MATPEKIRHTPALTHRLGGPATFFCCMVEGLNANDVDRAAVYPMYEPGDPEYAPALHDRATVLRRIADHLTDGSPNPEVEEVLQGLGTGDGVDLLLDLSDSPRHTLELLANATNSDPLRIRS